MAMRLTSFEINTIKTNAMQFFGAKTQVLLFGSRVDYTKKGGDIDLYIIPENQNNVYEKKIKFLNALDTCLGEQKIDVVIAKSEDSFIKREALEKGIELNLENIKLEKILKECDKHLQRINEAYGDMSSFMLLNAVKYEVLSKNEIQAIDQYLFRFAKLQDSMGEKLFRLLLAKFEENIDKFTFLDIIRKLEKYTDITIENEWVDLRKIRNQLTHEYEDDSIQMSNMINLIYAKKEVIERIYLALKEKCHF